MATRAMALASIFAGSACSAAASHVYASIGSATSGQLRNAPTSDTWKVRGALPRSARPKTSAQRRERRAQVGNRGNWPQEHFDTYNSGSTSFIGPGDVDGFCRQQVLASSIFDSNADILGSTGVSSMNSFDLWFGGGSSNVFRMIQLTSSSTFDQWSVNLTALNPAPGFAPATAYGIVSSSAAWAYDMADNVAVPSADGTVYMLWWLSCVNSTVSATTGKPLKMDRLEAEKLAMQIVPPSPAPGSSFDPSLAATVYRVNEATVAALTGEEGVGGQDPFPTCVQWAAVFAGRKPSYSPTRYAVGSGNAPTSLVLASETDPFVDVGGVLHAFNAATGQEMWNFAAIDELGISWGLMGVVPAVDQRRDNTVFLAYGPRVVALSALTGQIVGSTNISSVPVDPATPDDYIYRGGTLTGNQIAFNTCTYEVAVAMCNALPVCVGFTHQAADMFPTTPVDIAFFGQYLFTPAPFGSTFQKPGFGQDPFVSSPVFSIDGDAIFLHSAAGTLWRIEVSGDSTGISMRASWGCDYVVNPPNGYSPCADVPAAYHTSLPAPVHVHDGTTFVRPGNMAAPDREVVHRGDYVHGGWHQPTTRGQRDELHAAVRDMYLAHIQGAGSVTSQKGVRGTTTSASSAGESTGPGDADAALLDAVAAGVQPSTASFAAMVRALSDAGRLDEVHALRTPSGYTKLGRDGRALHPIGTTVGAISKGYTSLYPYSTPASPENDLFIEDVLVVPQYLPYQRGDEGVFCVFMSTGDVQWSVNSWPTAEGLTVKYGRSRASPAIDGDNFVYVSADIDDPARWNNATGYGARPVLFALSLADGLLVWATTAGFATGSTVGHASPIVIDGYQEDNAAWMASDRGLVLLTEGVPCPTDDPVYDCSGHGSCDCQSGQCTCDPNNLCYGGAGCAPIVDCGAHGSCETFSGNCACDPCFRGATCDSPLTCQAHATCIVDSDSCVCDAGYIPDGSGNCVSNGPTPTSTASAGASASALASASSSAAGSGGGNNAPASGAPPAAVAAGVLVGAPALLLGVAAAWIVMFKYRNPLKPWHAALPPTVATRLGYASYSSSFASPVIRAPGPAGSSGSGGASPGARAGDSSPIKTGIGAAAARSFGFRGGIKASTMPAIVTGNKEDSLARTRLLSTAASSSAASGSGSSGAGAFGSKPGGGYGAV